jgi:2-oxoglutarate dehydrogenase E1 component
MAISFANRFNADLLDQNYERWRKDPASVDPTWSAFFEGFELGSVQPKNGAAATSNGAAAPAGESQLQTRVDGLVYAYRTLGHTIANLDPLAHERPQNTLLSLRELGFDEKDLDLTVSSKFLLGGQRMKLREMIAALERIYCGPVGTEFMHIQNPRVRNWLRDKIENRPAETTVSPEVQRRVLRQLVKVESFEHFLHTKYQGQKRFSLEGGESLITALYGILENCPARGVEEICMGMAHRGRLSVIAEFLRKPYRVMFAEFSENYAPNTAAGDGDVKYHLGYATTRTLKTGGEVEVRLSANPSHLEAVNPVVMGMTRARQRIRQDTDDRRKVISVLVHGDAAFAGQGMVAENLNMSQLQGYRIGGTIHIIVNNQIGFTTLPADARSTTYCTDVAKMIEAPIFHVNGDNPLAVRFVSELALEFRQTFKRDVVIDIYCYRRYGHNEADDPVSTQPTMYADITTHPSVGTLFEKKLVTGGIITQEEADTLDKEMEGRHEKALDIVKTAEKEQKIDKFTGSTASRQPPYNHDPVETGVSKENLAKIVRALTTVPEGFSIQTKLKSFLLEKRAKVWANGGPFDWAYGEALAMGSLLLEGVPVRLSGQDARRGTFSQRNSYLYDQKTRERYCPLKHIDPEQAQICIYNSLLSEAGVLGFDYGYSLNFPNLLCMWEAQFGDFAKWRAGHHRPVHLLGGVEVAASEQPRAAPSPWLRRAGSGALLRAAGAFPSALCRRQHPGLQSDHTRAVLPRPAPPDEAILQEAAHHHDAQVDAPPRGCGLQARGLHQRPLPRNPALTAARKTGADQARHPLHRQGLLRPPEIPRRQQDRQCGHHPRRAALSAR